MSNMLQRCEYSGVDCLEKSHFIAVIWIKEIFTSNEIWWDLHSWKWLWWNFLTTRWRVTLVLLWKFETYSLGFPLSQRTKVFAWNFPVCSWISMDVLTSLQFASKPVSSLWPSRSSFRRTDIIHLLLSRLFTSLILSTQHVFHTVA